MLEIYTVAVIVFVWLRLEYKLGKLEQIFKHHGEARNINENEDEKDFCKPPNITYCKQSIYPDYDCSKCKWKIAK